jgi:hypothetical protein
MGRVVGSCTSTPWKPVRPSIAGLSQMCIRYKFQAAIRLPPHGHRQGRRRLRNRHQHGRRLLRVQQHRHLVQRQHVKYARIHHHPLRYTQLTLQYPN